MDAPGSTLVNGWMRVQAFGPGCGGADGCMSAWVHGWMDGWMDGWIGGRTDGRTDGCTDDGTTGFTDERIVFRRLAAAWRAASASGRCRPWRQAAWPSPSPGTWRSAAPGTPIYNNYNRLRITLFNIRQHTILSYVCVYTYIHIYIYIYIYSRRQTPRFRSHSFRTPVPPQSPPLGRLRQTGGVSEP